MSKSFLFLSLFIFLFNPFAISIPMQGKSGELIFGSVFSESIILSSHGNYFACWAEYGHHVWNLHTGELVLSLPTESLDWEVTYPRYGRFNFSPDETRFVHALENRVEIYDLQSGRQLFSIDLPEKKVNQVAYSPDGKKIIGLIHYQTQIAVWDAELGVLTNLYNAKDFLADQNDSAHFYNLFYPFVTLLIRNPDLSSRVQEINLETGDILLSPRGIFFDRSQNARLVLRDASTTETIISLDDLQDPKSLFQFSFGLYDPWNFPGIREAFFLPGEDRFWVTFGWGGDSYVFDLADYSLLKKLPDFAPVSVSKADHPDRILVSYQDPLIIRLYDYVKEEIVREYHQGIISDFITNVSLSPEGNYLLTSTKDQHVILWDVHSGKPVREFESTHIGYFLSDEEYVTLNAFNGSVYILSVDGTVNDSLLHVPASDRPGIVSVGKQILAYTDYTAFYYRVPTHNYVYVYSLHPLEFLGKYQLDNLRNMAVSQEGFHIVCLTEDGRSFTIDPRQQEIHSGPLLWQPVQNDYNLMGFQTLQITRDGKEALLYGMGRENSDYNVELNLWDLVTGERKASYPYNNSVNNVLLSPDEKYVMASCGSEFFVWDKETGNVHTHNESQGILFFSLTRNYTQIAYSSYGIIHGKAARIRKLIGLEIPTSGLSIFENYR